MRVYNIVCILCFVALIIDVSNGFPPRLATVHSGRGAPTVPTTGGARIPTGFTDVTGTVGTNLDLVDSNFVTTSITSNLGEYNCQIFTFYVTNNTQNCSYLQADFSYWGLESGNAYTNSDNQTFVPPIPDIWASVFNPTTLKFEIFGTASTNLSWFGSPQLFQTTTNSDYFFPLNNSCLIAYGVCSVVFSDASTPIIYSWQGEDKGYRYLGELGEGYLSPLPRAWELSPNYFQAGPVYPDGFYVFPGSSFASVDRGGNQVWELQYCEEKEEFSFTDSLELSYVDVPVGVSVFPDYHRTPTLFGVYDAQITNAASCVDQDGKNCLSTISAEDGDEWIVSTAPGVTPSYLELGLGVTSPPANLKLILTMRYFKNLLTWRRFPPVLRSTELQIFDASLDDWISVPSPYSLSLRGPNGIVYNSTDFDKTTRVVDLTGMSFSQTPGSELKLRLAFYWQYLPIAVDRVQLDMTAGYTVPTPTVLTPVYADLHFRGFSVDTRLAAANIPGYSPTYSPVTPMGVPLDMSGNLTHYGDVLSLIESNDDEYVIMGTGDEMTLRFQAPSSDPSTGFDRFVRFHSRCYYKAEGKATGRTVDPLPYFAMPKYPYNPATDSYPSASHQTFLAGNTRSYQASVAHFSLYSDKVALNVTVAPPRNTSTSTTSTTTSQMVSGVSALTPSWWLLGHLTVALVVLVFLWL